MKIDVTILGCGGAPGVPMISSGWGDCDPNNPKNNRLRSSVYLNVNGTGILIDTGPDLRQQLLRAGTPKIDAVLYTHLHADHTDGVNELREINRINKKPLPIYGDKPTLDSLYERFPYAFLGVEADDFYRAVLEKHEIIPYEPFVIGNVTVTPFLQDHGFMDSIGFRVGDFAYSTDVVKLSEQSLAAVAGVKVWIIGCLSPKYHLTHADVPQILKWQEIIHPKKIILTHMGNHLDYEQLRAKLPNDIEPAYDGMQFSIDC